MDEKIRDQIDSGTAWSFSAQDVDAWAKSKGIHLSKPQVSLINSWINGYNCLTPHRSGRSFAATTLMMYLSDNKRK